MSSAGVALADTYQGVATHDGAKWTVVWTDVSPTCGAFPLDNAAVGIVATIDGVDISLVKDTAYQYPTLDENSIVFLPSSGGVLSKVTFQGQDSFQCDSHTFLLPGYVAPPAPVPTVSEWAMILLGMMLAGGAALTIHRRRTA